MGVGVGQSHGRAARWVHRAELAPEHRTPGLAGLDEAAPAHACPPRRTYKQKDKLTMLDEAATPALNACLPRRCPHPEQVSPALAAGCTVVLKPSELTPLTGGWAGSRLGARLAGCAGLPCTRRSLPLLSGAGILTGRHLPARPRAALALAELGCRAGLPPGVLNVLAGDAAAIGDAMMASPVVRGALAWGSGPRLETIRSRALAALHADAAWPVHQPPRRPAQPPLLLLSPARCLPVQVRKFGFTGSTAVGKKLMKARAGHSGMGRAQQCGQQPGIVGALLGCSVGQHATATPPCA